MRPTATPKLAGARRPGLVPRIRVLGVLALVAAVLGACEKEPAVEAPGRLVLTPVAFDEIPGWAEDRLSEALPALARSCARLAG